MVFKVFKTNLFLDSCLYDLLGRLNYLREKQAAIQEEVNLGYSLLIAGDSPEADPSNNGYQT
jgi:hypothetical protein